MLRFCFSPHLLTQAGVPYFSYQTLGDSHKMIILIHTKLYYVIYAYPGTLTSGSRSVNSFHSGLSSNLAHKSHKALIIAATARCITPFSGPIFWLSSSELVNWQVQNNARHIPIAIVIHWLIHAKMLRSEREYPAGDDDPRLGTSVRSQPFLLFLYRGRRWKWGRSQPQCPRWAKRWHSSMNNRDRCAVINTHQTHELNSEYIDRRNETNAAKAMHLLPSHQIRGRRVTLANEYLSHQPISPSNAPRYFANFSTLTYSILVMYCKKK